MAARDRLLSFILSTTLQRSSTVTASGEEGEGGREGGRNEGEQLETNL